MPGYQESAGPLVAALRTRGLFCLVRVSESRWATRSRTANKGVVSPCRVVMKPLGYPEQNCEQGGCFVLSGCHEAARPPGAGLRTRGLFYLAWVSESSWATRSSTANKGVVLSCRGIRKQLGHAEQNCEQGGCFFLRDIRKQLGHPKQHCEQGGCFILRVSGSCCATRSRTANKGVVLSCRGIRKPPGLPKQDCEQGEGLSGYHKAIKG